MSRFLASVAALTLCSSFATAARGEDADKVRREDALKAAYLFNFTKFVDWPGDANTLTLCFVGAPGIERALAENVAGKRIGTHPVNVRDIAAIADLSGCNVLFIETIAGHAHFIAAGSRLPVLTVSDEAGFVHQGGIIELFTEGNRLRFSVNVTNARRAGLRISSSLLQLASVVEKDDEP